MMGESEHYSYIRSPASSSQVIRDQGGRTMVSVSVTADDCFGHGYKLIAMMLLCRPVWWSLGLA